MSSVSITFYFIKFVCFFTFLYINLKTVDLFLLYSSFLKFSTSLFFFILTMNVDIIWLYFIFPFCFLSIHILILAIIYSLISITLKFPSMTFLLYPQRLRYRYKSIHQMFSLVIQWKTELFYVQNNLLYFLQNMNSPILLLPYAITKFIYDLLTCLKISFLTMNDIHSNPINHQSPEFYLFTPKTPYSCYYYHCFKVGLYHS